MSWYGMVHVSCVYQNGENDCDIIRKLNKSLIRILKQENAYVIQKQLSTYPQMKQNHLEGSSGGSIPCQN